MEYVNVYVEYGHRTGYGLEEQENYNKVVSHKEN